MIVREPHPPFHEERMVAGAAEQVFANVNRFFSKARVQRAAMQDERARLARELHDGVLQSLTGAALQLEALSRLLKENPHVQKRLCEIEQVITGEQRALRAWIENLKSKTATPSMMSYTDLASALEKLSHRAEWQWGICVDVIVADGCTIPRSLADQIYRLAQEALTNIGRHAHARVAQIDIRTTADQAQVTIIDDGCGFPFRGRYDLATLMKRGLGPVSLKERVASLSGELLLTSSPGGTRLEISVPLRGAELQASHR